jgi:hypothetical protein
VGSWSFFLRAMMNKETLIKDINRLARLDNKRRRDPRFLKIIGFLMAKGFLYCNEKIPLYPNEHINLRDAVWAGRLVEPRILEVLPAAYARFTNHFSGDANIIQTIEQVIKGIKQPNDHTIEFYGIPLEKIKPWFFIRLKDGRSKPLDKRKVSKTYRFKPETIDALKNLKDQTGKTETEIIEDLIRTRWNQKRNNCHDSTKEP